MEKTNLVPLGMHGCACAGCGRPLVPEDLIACCSDCGGIFCRDCVEDGTYASHACDPDDED